jgi:hypothetical protein
MQSHTQILITIAHTCLPQLCMCQGMRQARLGVCLLVALGDQICLLGMLLARPRRLSRSGVCSTTRCVRGGAPAGDTRAPHECHTAQMPESEGGSCPAHPHLAGLAPPRHDMACMLCRMMWIATQDVPLLRSTGKPQGEKPPETCIQGLYMPPLESPAELRFVSWLAAEAGHAPDVQRGVLRARPRAGQRRPPSGARQVVPEP